MRYAVFPDKQRLLIETHGSLATYDSGDHRIGGVAQADSGHQTVAFTSQNGIVKLDELKKLD